MLDQTIKKIFEKSRRNEPEQPCPDAESLAMYIDKRLGKTQKELMERHLTECDLCLDQVVLCGTAQKEPVTRKAKSGVVDVMIRFLSSTVEVISELKEIQIVPMPTPLPVRGKTMPVSKAARFRREFDDLTVEVEVKSPNGTAGQINIGAYKDKHPMKKVRVSLLSDEKELASFLTKDGQVNFEYSKMGRYLIRLTQNRLYLAEITLEVIES